MADEKIILTEIDIDVDQSIKDTIALKEEIKELTEQTKLLKQTEGETSQEYIKAETALKVTKAELRSLEGMNQKVVQSNRANSGSIEQLRAQLSVVTKQWAMLTNEERKNTEKGKELSAQKLALTNRLEGEEKATGDARRGVGKYELALNALPGPMGRVVSGFKSMTKAAMTFVATPVGAIIAAIVLAIMALTSWFRRTEEGQNALTKATMVFKSILENLMDVVSSVGKAIYKAFTEPKEAIIALGELIKSQITNRIEAAKDVAKGFKKIFTKDWKEGLKEVGVNLVDVVTGVEDTVKKVGNAFKKVIKDINEDILLTRKLADMKAALDKRMRAEMVNDAKIEAEIAELREKAAEKDKYSAAERLAFMDEVEKKQMQLYQDDLDIAKQKAWIHAQEISMSDANKADLDEQARLEAEVFKVQQRNFEAIKSFQKQRQSAINESENDQRKAAEDQIKLLESELEAWKETNRSKIKSNELMTAAIVADEEKRITDEAEKKLNILNQELANKLKTEAEYNQEVLKIEAEKNNAIIDLRKEFEEQERDRKIEVAEINYQNDLELARGSIFAELEIEKQGLELKRQQEIAYAQKIGADVTKIEAKYVKARKILSLAERDAKLAIAQDFAKNIATIAGEGTKIGKIAAVASVTIEGIRSAQAAYSGMVETLPGPIGIVAGIVAAAASVTIAIANVKKILAVKTGLPGEDGGGGGGGSGLNAPSTVAPETAVRTTNAPEIGAGIISRQTQIRSGDQTVLQPTLVEDEVTNRQKRTINMNNTSVL